MNWSCSCLLQLQWCVCVIAASATGQLTPTDSHRDPKCLAGWCRSLAAEESTRASLGSPTPTGGLFVSIPEGCLSTLDSWALALPSFVLNCQAPGRRVDRKWIRLGVRFLKSKFLNRGYLFATTRAKLGRLGTGRPQCCGGVTLTSLGCTTTT